jgi:hypothetical protein
MEELADRLDAAADLLTTVDRSVPTLSVAAGAFAADDAGLPGRLGRELHHRWTTVLDARAREAAAAATRLSGLAQAVRAARREYADTDDEVARRVADRGGRRA